MTLARQAMRAIAPDPILIAAALSLVALGLLMIRGATVGDAPTVLTSATLRQSLYFGVGLLSFFGLRRTDYRLLQRWSVWVYLAAAASLGVVLALGTDAHGARRWIDIGPVTIQPSEFAKVATAIALAAFAAGRDPSRSAVAFTLALTAPPAALVLAEPDLGSTLALGVLWVVVVAIWGVSWRVLGGLALLALAILPVLFVAVPDYQRERIAVFVDPARDPLGTGFTSRQVEVALGGGGLTGRGFGGPSALEGLAPRTADFAFAQFAEQAGFAGSLVVLGLFVVVAWRGIRAATAAPDAFGRLLAAGLTATIVGQAALHIAVNLRLFPATGIPLPFISQGGSALVTVFTALGIIESIAAHRPTLDRTLWRGER
ncbi:MAG: rod shape-determining protein RodA [Dehalococcoidia bacterium]|nr:MAG: rod shape-determining protein RodA [Dehalococcoidia bacterium]